MSATFHSRWLLLGPALLAGLACSDAGTNNPIAPASVVTTPAPVRTELTVCKIGANGTFAMTVNGVAKGGFSLLDGECALVWTQTAIKYDSVVVTEAPSTAVLDSIVVVRITGSVSDPTGVIRTFTAFGTNSMFARIGAEFGSVLTFYNTQAPPPSGEIGDFVWNDVNGNGIQDAGEAGLPGQTVTLSGTVSATTTTGAAGDYLFSGLPAGTYTITVATPTGYTASPTGAGTPATDNNGSPASVILATNSSSDRTIDFGFFVPAPPPPSGEIGDFVWNDVNGNGIQDAGEAGLPGQTVTLSGTVSATTVTGAAGDYLFTGLPAGSYTVTVATPAGYTASPTGAGTPATDNNGSPASLILATNASSDRTIDFGFFVPAPPRGGQGCTPGYWKQSQHFKSWTAPYSPSTQFSAVFENAFPGQTLLQVLQNNGNTTGLDALGRHTVAALLDAANSGVSYNLTVAQVISQFNAVYPGTKSAYIAQKDVFEAFNTQGCPLN